MRRLLLTLSLLAGCYLKHYPVTPIVVQDSTYQAFAKSGAFGTAWVIADGYLATAGHVCDATMPDLVLLQSRAGFHVYAKAVYWVTSAGNRADACVLQALGPVGPPLILADHPPAKGTPDGFVGFPRGIFTVSSGTYQGDMASNAPCDHGASGSAMFTTRGVYAILVDARPDNATGCLGTPIAVIEGMLDEMGVRYTVTPDDPTLGDPLGDVEHE